MAKQQSAPIATPGPAATVPSSASQPPLKHLQVVHQAGTLAYSTTEHIYKRVKSASPTFVAPGYQRLEGIAGQVVPQVTETAESLLRTADSTVDTLLDGLPVEAAKDLSSRTGLDKLLQSLSAAGDYVVILAKHSSASVSAGVQSARDTLQSAVDTAREATDPDVGLAMAQDAWTKFAAYPPVKAFLERAEPATNLAIQTFLTVHDGLVASPVYKTAVDTTASTLNYAYTTTPYKLGAQYLYPLVQPVADPAINKVSNSKVFGQVLDYWKPVQPQANAAPAVSAH